MADFSFNVEKKIGVLSTRTFGGEETWNKEINIVSWNGGHAKYDIREWDSKHERMTKGITLTRTEAKKLMEALTDHFFHLESID